MTQKLHKSYSGLIRPGDIIKHEKFMDVAVNVSFVGCLEVGATSILVAGEWMNQGFEKSWNIGKMTLFDIPVDKLTEWYLCVNPEADECLRKCEWTVLGYK